MAVEIPLTRGYFAIIDEEDLPLVSASKWQAARRTTKVYASHRFVDTTTGKQRWQYMHAMLTGFKMTDHINGNGLDNRRCNLRAATLAENMWNVPKTKGRSRFKGVDFHKASGLWRVRIRANDKVHSVGYFRDETEGALAYDQAARDLHGQFAVLNFAKPGERAAIPQAGSP